MIWMGEDEFNVDQLMAKADMLFESDKEINTLKTYLEKVTGYDVSLGNFTPKQTKALFKVMGIDKLYLEPCDQVDEKDNACKQIVKVVIELSRGKKGFGFDKIESILKAKMGIDEDQDVLTSEDEEEAEDNEE